MAFCDGAAAPGALISIPGIAFFDAAPGEALLSLGVLISIPGKDAWGYGFAGRRNARGRLVTVPFCGSFAIGMSIPGMDNDVDGFAGRWGAHTPFDIFQMTRHLRRRQHRILRPISARRTKRNSTNDEAWPFNYWGRLIAAMRLNSCYEQLAQLTAASQQVGEVVFVQNP